MSTDRRRPRIANYKLLTTSSDRFSLVVTVTILVALFFESSFALSLTTFGSVLQNDLFAAPAPRHDANTDGSSNHPGVQPGADSFPIRKGYWCEYCSVGFNKHKSYLEHMAGKRHGAVIAEGDLVWEDYLARSGGNSVFWDASVTKMDVAKSWSLDVFAEGLRARGRSSKKKFVGSGRSTANYGMLSSSSSSSPSPLHTGNNGNSGGGNQIDPTLHLEDLPPSKRAALFRYLHATSSGIPCLPDMVEALPPRYVRIKELLESIEVYHRFREVILERSAKRGKSSQRLAKVYDIGCGHGLVGMLIAAGCPHITVFSIDRVPRDSFVAQKDAFEAAGMPLTNLEFETGDLSTIRGKHSSGNSDADDDHTLVVCVHGCKELTHESIELAREKNWAWLAVPCCLQAGDHLGKETALKIQSDHTRYAMLCGVIAANYHPEVITTIDPRITGRGIVLASSGGMK